MTNRNKLEVLLSLKDELTKGMDKAAGNFQKNSKAIGTAATAMGLAIGAVGVVGVKAFADFEQTMQRVGAVSNTLGTQTFVQLEKAARDAGKATVFTANESAGALAFMAQAGLDAKDSIAALPKVLELASAGQLDIAASADLVTNVMAGFGLAAEELGRANDVLVTGFTKANTDLTQLGQAFKFAGPIAKAAGVSFEETTAALALMGNAGIQATMAGTALRGAITRLLSPTKEAQRALDRMGIVATDSEGSLLPLADILGQFERVGLSAADAMTIFGLRAGPGMLALLEQGSDALVNLTSEMENAGGTAERISKAQLETFNGQVKLLKSALMDVAITIGEILVPALRAIAERVMPIIKNISDWMDRNERLGRTLVTVVAAVGATLLVLGPLLIVLPQIVKAISLVRVALTFLAAHPIILFITAIVVAIVLLRKAWTSNFGDIQGKTASVLDFIRDKFNQLVDFLRVPFTKIKELYESKLGFLLPGGPLIKGIIFLKNNWREVLSFMGKFFQDFVNFFIRRAQDILRVVDAVAGAFGKDSNLAASLSEIEIDWEAVGDKIAEVTRDVLDKAGEMVAGVKGFLVGGGDSMEAALEKGATAWDIFKKKVVTDVNEITVAVTALNKLTGTIFSPGGAQGGLRGPANFFNPRTGSLSDPVETARRLLAASIPPVIEKLEEFEEALDPTGILTLDQAASFTATVLRRLADATQAEIDAKERARRLDAINQFVQGSGLLAALNAPGANDFNLRAQFASGRPTGPVGIGALRAVFGAGAITGQTFGVGGTTEFVQLPNGERLVLNRIEGELAFQGETLGTIIGNQASSNQ